MVRKSRLCFVGLLLCAVVFGFAVGGVFAQGYPQKPIRFIVPYTAGGSADVPARIIADKLKGILGQPVLVENRPGADGRLGTEVVVRAAADGYTLLYTTNGPLTIAPSLFIKLPYDPVRDFEPITLGTQSVNFFLVHPSVLVKSVGELVNLAKSKPGKLNYGSSGLGQLGHVYMELFKTVAGIDIMHVPYKGASESTTALLGKHVDMAFASVASSVPQVKAGTLKALAVTSVKRSPLAPDVPTMVESGFPDIVATNWSGVFAPARTPKEIVAKLNTEIVKILKMPDVGERMLKSGLEPTPCTPQELFEFVKSDTVKWAKLLKDAGIQPQ